MKTILIKAASGLLFIVGFISLVTPIPGAFIFFACSLTLLVSVSPYSQFCIQWIRSRVAWINSFLHWMENKAGKRIKMVGETLSKTHPLAGTESQNLSHKKYVQKKLEEENN